MGKTYLALVRGGEKSFPARSGEIRDALEFSDGRVSIGESCAAKFAATDWELLASSVCILEPLSLLVYSHTIRYSPQHPYRCSGLLYIQD